MPAERFQTKLVFSLSGIKLSPVHGPIILARGSSAIDYRRECLVTSLGSTGNECGWAIQMHKDTKVELQYLYFPDPDEHPDLTLRQPDAPAPMVFTSSGWFHNSIDLAKLEPIGAPR